MMNWIKAGCLVVLVVAVCLFLWSVTRWLDKVQANLDAVTKNLDVLQLDVSGMQATLTAASLPVIKHLDGAVTDLGRTVQIAGGVLNVTRQIERDNRTDIAAVNQKTLVTLGHVDDLVVSFDASQKQASQSIQQTSAALLPVMDQTKRDLEALEPAIEQVTPLLKQSTAIAGNLNATTADVQTEIHKFVYPPPRKWYQKYILDPVKTMVHLITIPIGHA